MKQLIAIKDTLIAIIGYYCVAIIAVVHPMGVGVSISSRIELGLDSQMSGLTSSGLLPIEMR